MDWTALQARTNAACLSAFGDATIVLDGVVVTGDFCEPSDQVYLDGVSAMATRPQVVVMDGDVPAEPVGKPCIAGPLGQSPTAWLVADARPDGHGMTVLYLERPL